MQYPDPEMVEMDVEIGHGEVTFPVPIPVTTVSQVLISGAVGLVGWSLRETTGAAVATVEFVDGGSAGGTIIGEVSLAAGASDTEPVSDKGVLARQGIYMRVIAGSVTGAIYVRR